MVCIEQGEKKNYGRSILSSENSITSIFELQNILTDSDLSNYEYTFSASLKRAYNIFS